jgi:hypothetical protein
MLCVAVVVYVLTGDATLGCVCATVPVIGTTVTTQETQNPALVTEMGGDIVLSDVERKVTNLRPDVAPLDTMIRLIGSRPTDSYSVMWAESGFSGGHVEALAPVTQNSAGDTVSITLTPDSYRYAVLSSVFLYADTSIGKNVGLYVLEKNSSTKEIVCQVIGGTGAGDQIGSGGIAAGTELFFTGVAKNELDAQTEAYQQMPELQENYCQIQMCQIEQGLYDQKQKKELDWGLLEFKSDALYKFRYGCENTLLMGIKSKFQNQEGKDIYTAGGLENYVGWHLKYVPNAAGSAGGLDIYKFFELGEAVFTNIAGSDSRVFFMSPQLMTQFLKSIEFQKMVAESKTNLVHGLRCNEIDTGFGLFNIRLHKGLGLTRKGEGCVVDLSRIRMRAFDSMHWRDIDLLGSGQSKAEAWTLEERVTAEFRAKATHAWVYPVKNSSEAGIVEL